MIIYHAIICHERDVHYLDEHIVSVNRVSNPMERCVYFGASLSGDPPKCHLPHHVVGAFDLYENLPLKTFCLLEHALAAANWDVLLKTDANTEVLEIDWQLASRYELTGHIGEIQSSRIYHANKVCQSALSEGYSGPLPSRWVGGPAYCLNRQLARLIVARGIWYARGHAYEDQMVSLVAEESGFVAQQGIRYKEPEK